MEKQQPALYLRVLNGNNLESGKSANYIFDHQGGSIGSAESNTWSVQDQLRSIDRSHLKVEWRDGAFCLQVLSSRPVTVNNAPITFHSGLVRLQQGDVIEIGSLQLGARISMQGKDTIDPLLVPPETLVSSYSNPLDEMLENAPKTPFLTEPQSQIAPTVANSFSQDPLTVLDSENLTTLDRSIDTEINSAYILQQGHYTGSSHSHVLSDNIKDTTMDQEYIDLPEITNPYRKDGDDHTLRTAKLEKQLIAITPLMRGLDVQLPIHNSQDANDFLEEIGKTLQAAIKGLLELQKLQNGLSDKHLRPIEDNPLRLNMDYQTSMDVLFADQKSPVHLSAPAAVSESLNNLHLHHEANKIAITRALTALLDAFSPDALLSRFSQYRRSSEQRYDTDDAWSWKMYCSYYKELASSRQQGFEKLFSEIYEQVYDHELRRCQQEKKA